MEDTVVINEKIKERNMENNYIRFTPSNNFILKKVETRCLEDKWKSTHVSTKITGLCKNCNTEKEIIYDLFYCIICEKYLINHNHKKIIKYI